MTRPISCIREQVSRSEAERIVTSAGGQDASVERALYYPYLWYRMRYRLTTLFGRPRFQVDCLVDARKGLVSTTDPFETLEVRPSPRDILTDCVTRNVGADAARRTCIHEATRKHRAVIPLQLDVAQGAKRYKKFWVVRCGSAGTRILVDSTSGRFITLASTA